MSSGKNMDLRLVLAAVMLPLLLAGCARRHESTGPTVSGEQPPAASAAKAEHAPGRAIYDQYCKLCHGADASGYAADNAPSLVSRTFLETATDDFIAHAIRVGRPNTSMAAYGKSRGGALDEIAIKHLVKFLRDKGPPPKTLPKLPPTGDAARGAASYDKNCRACHGTESARGSALLIDNPELLASASPEFLRYAIVHGRPPTTMPAFGEKLPSGEIEDILAWLRSRTPTGPASPPVASVEIPADLPVVLNPKGKHPAFELRAGRFVAAEQVKIALEQKRRIVIVDARSPADWIQFRIPGSIPVPYHDLSRLDRIPNDGTWVVAYCACPHHASGEIVDALKKRNHVNAAVLDEGILVWKERGYPLAGEAVPKPEPSAKGPATLRAK